MNRTSDYGSENASLNLAGESKITILVENIKMEDLQAMAIMISALTETLKIDDSEVPLETRIKIKQIASTKLVKCLEMV